MSILKQITVGPLGTNCYIFGDDKSKEVVIVDPGDEGERIIRLINENNYKVKYIILTHGHFDHIGAVKYLKDLTGAQVLIHSYDKSMLIDPNQNFSALFTTPDEYSVQCLEDGVLSDNDILPIGDKTIKIIHTPGHSMGGVCILFENKLFSGDTLFKETIGRTDLPKGSHSALLDSVKKLMLLEDDIEVYPGHGESTDIGYERRFNPYIK